MHPWVWTDRLVATFCKRVICCLLSFYACVFKREKIWICIVMDKAFVILEPPPLAAYVALYKGILCACVFCFLCMRICSSHSKILYFCGSRKKRILFSHRMCFAFL